MSCTCTYLLTLSFLRALQCLLVSTVLGTVSSLHPTSFLMIFILVSLIFIQDCTSSVARGEVPYI